MKKVIKTTLLPFKLICLSACCTVSKPSGSPPAPLNVVLNEVKAEIRSVYQDIEADRKSGGGKYVLKCGNESHRAKIAFKKIDLTLSVLETKTRSLGANTNLNSGPGITFSSNLRQSISEGNKVTINMAPDLKNFKTSSDDIVKEGGLADVLTKTLVELVKVDNKEPCLRLGYEGKNSVVIQLDFEASDYNDGATNINLVLVNIGGGGSNALLQGHRLVAKIDVTREDGAPGETFN